MIQVLPIPQVCISPWTGHSRHVVRVRGGIWHCGTALLSSTPSHCQVALGSGDREEGLTPGCWAHMGLLWPNKGLERFGLVVRYSQTSSLVGPSPPMIVWPWCVYEGHTESELVRYGQEWGYLCLKRPSFYCLIHFYKRCVSSLALMGRSPWVRSGWVSVLSVTTFFIQG